MLQVSVLRDDTEAVKKKLSIKHFKQPDRVDEVIQLDDTRKRLQLELDALQTKVNAASREIGQQMGQGKKEEAAALKMEVANWKAAQEPLKEQMEDAEKKLQELLFLLPNLPGPRVPEGRSPEENVVVREGILPAALPADALPHWELAKKYQLIDFELGNKITGSGFPVYMGKGAKLQRSLIQYFLDFNTEAGYTEYIPPFVVNAASAFGTGQLPDKEGQMYYMPEDDFYLIPTAEVPMTNIYRDSILKESDFPIKMTAYSPCFRREAGSYGKDVRGLNRLHQFEKVEIIQVVAPEKSYAILDEMVSHVERLLQTLGLPYRLLLLCGGDMGFASATTYDFEVYSAAQQRWLEVSSVSNFENFQSNRLKCRYKAASGKMQFVHTLNGSSLALPRILAALLENNQTPNGILLPEVLHRYMGTGMIN